MQCDREVGKQPEKTITASLMELHKCKPSFTLRHLTRLLCCLHFVCFGNEKRCITLDTIYINAQCCLLD